MKKSRLLYICFSLLFFIGCYEDKGNYDYLNIDVNKITIRYPVYGITIYMGEPVVFTPTLTYANKEQQDTNIYTWEYHFNYLGLVCTERNMNMVFTDVVPGRSYDGIVIATDITTGAKYSQNISFTYRSPYVIGWLLLANDGGKSKLHMLREINGEWSKVEDLYQTIHQKDLGSQPREVIVNRNGRNEVRIIQDGTEGSLVLNGGTYEYITTFADEFLGGIYPTGFKPKGFSGGGNISVMSGTSGETYAKTYNSSTTYPHDMFPRVPLTYGTDQLDVQFLLVDPRGGTYSPYMYDRNTKSFYMIYGASYYYAGVVYPLKAAEDWDAQGAPPPNNFTGYELVASEVKASSSYMVDIITLLKKEDTGDLFMYTFSHSSSGSSFTTPNVTDIYYEAFGAAALVDNNTLYHFLRQRPYLFFAPGNRPGKLYCYDLRTKSAWELKDFGSKILSIESNYVDDNSICVALENGKVIIQDVKEDTFMSGEDNVIFETTLSGKIVDVFYKRY